MYNLQEILRSRKYGSIFKTGPTKKCCWEYVSPKKLKDGNFSVKFVVCPSDNTNDFIIPPKKPTTRRLVKKYLSDGDLVGTSCPRIKHELPKWVELYFRPGIKKKRCHSFLDAFTAACRCIVA